MILKKNNIIGLNKVVFLHPTKTAGTSFRRLANPRFVGRKHSPVEEMVSMERKSVEEFKDEGYTFLITVRNPYSRFVSMYNFFGSKRFETLDDYLDHVPQVIGRGRNLIMEQHRYYVEGSEVIRFENFQEEAKAIIKKYGNEHIEDVDVVRNVNPSRVSFKLEDLTQEQKDKIYEIYKEDFNLFGYER